MSCRRKLGSQEAGRCKYMSSMATVTAAFKPHVDYFSSQRFCCPMAHNIDIRQGTAGINFAFACETLSVREYDRTDLPFVCAIMHQRTFVLCILCVALVYASAALHSSKHCKWFLWRDTKVLGFRCMHFRLTKLYVSHPQHICSTIYAHRRIKCPVDLSMKLH